MGINFGFPQQQYQETLPNVSSQFSGMSTAQNFMNQSYGPTQSTGPLTNMVQPSNYENFQNLFANPNMNTSMVPDIGVQAPSWADKWFGGVDQKTGKTLPNRLGTLASLANAGMNAYLGYKQLGIAEDTLDFQKDSFSSQFEMQRSDVNRQLEDRQQRRVDSSGANAMSVEDYMKKYGV